jgi:hypothetical protein
LREGGYEIVLADTLAAKDKRIAELEAEVKRGPLDLRD